jgi:hypothetical protein
MQGGDGNLTGVFSFFSLMYLALLGARGRNFRSVRNGDSPTYPSKIPTLLLPSRSLTCSTRFTTRSSKLTSSSLTNSGPSF